MKGLVFECSQHPHNRKLCGKRSISAQETAMKKKVFFSKIWKSIYFSHFSRSQNPDFHVFGDVFCLIIIGIPIENGPSGRQKSLCDGFHSKIRPWDGSISKVTWHNDHQVALFDRFDGLLWENIFTFFFWTLARSRTARQIDMFSIKIWLVWPLLWPYCGTRYENFDEMLKLCSGRSVQGSVWCRPENLALAKVINNYRWENELRSSVWPLACEIPPS